MAQPRTARPKTRQSKSGQSKSGQSKSAQSKSAQSRSGQAGRNRLVDTPDRRTAPKRQARSVGRPREPVKARAGSSRPDRRTTATRPAPLLAVTGSAVWAVVIVAAVATGPVLAAVIVVPVGVVATASTLRATEAGRTGRRRASSRTPRKRPATGRRTTRGRAGVLGPLVLAVVVPFAALAGVWPGVAALAVFAVLAVVWAAAGAVADSPRPLRPALATAGALLAPTVASTAVVMARQQGTTMALALICAVLAFDAGAYVMGHGRTALGGPVGVAFGFCSVAVVGLFAAAVMNPPFSGNRPWVAFAVAGVAAAAGVKACEMIAPRVRLPALRRLDSLWLAAPAWVACSATLLHR